MLPRELKASTFAEYPPLARKTATEHLTLLQQLPIGFVSLLMRELVAYDWKFPAERKEMDEQLSYLAGLSPEQRASALAAFAKIELSPELDRMDWVNQTMTFSEKFSAHLWATHQIDAFRTAAIVFFDRVNAAAPQRALPVDRLGIVVAGQGVTESLPQLFRKLRRQGTYYSQVDASDGLRVIVDGLKKRAVSHPVPYAHWYIDGGTPSDLGSSAAVSVSYAALTPARAALQERMQRAYESAMGAEAFRSMLSRLRPEELGLSTPEDGLLNRFQVSLLTEGSGTQVYSTVFVQWAAREALRRAQPLTLLARFTPRQRERGMNELLHEANGRSALDPRGSLIDAGMGAYYTWLNLQRLSGAERSRFLVWFENHPEALAIAPGIEKGGESAARVHLGDLLDHVTRA